LEQYNEEDVADNMKKALFIFELTEKENLIKMVKEKYFEKQNKK
ncbi:TPA: transcriptional regulator, partial [Bacillus wiedmannii]|nr:transcriptional regulator [Bacillus wiedmannii]